MPRGIALSAYGELPIRWNGVSACTVNPETLVPSLGGAPVPVSLAIPLGIVVPPVAIVVITIIVKVIAVAIIVRRGPILIPLTFAFSISFTVPFPIPFPRVVTLTEISWLAHLGVWLKAEA